MRGIINRSRILMFGVFALLLSGSALTLIAAPGKVATQTAAAKAAPASAVQDKPAAKAPDAKAAAKAPAAAVPQGPKVLTPPPIAGMQQIVSPDKAKLLLPDKSKSIASAKSFSQAMKELEDAKNKDAKKDQKKKPIKTRAQIIDAKVCVWANSAENAEMFSVEAVRKYVGLRGKYTMKDSLFVSDSSKYICVLRFSYKDEVPETWYLESEMSTGFGKSYERAFADAMAKAAARAKKVQNTADWGKAAGSSKGGAELGIIPYDFIFATVSKEYYCKVFFRYFMPRDK